VKALQYGLVLFTIGVLLTIGFSDVSAAKNDNNGNNGCEKSNPNSKACEKNPNKGSTTPPDSDGDGVPDSEDLCPGFDDNIDVDADGIPDGCDILIDSDNDGVADSDDVCPGFDDNIDVDADGIPDGCDTLIDSDNDGVADSVDSCPFTPLGTDVDETGCPIVTTDPFTLCDTNSSGGIDLTELMAHDPTAPLGEGSIAAIESLAGDTNTNGFIDTLGELDVVNTRVLATPCLFAP